MTKDQIKNKARDIAHAARDAEWQGLSALAEALADDGDEDGAEAALQQMADRLDGNVSRLLDGVEEAVRSDVAAAVVEFLGRVCGVM